MTLQLTGWAILAVVLAVTIYDFLVANHGVEYFRTFPAGLLIVLAVAGLGGVIFIVTSHLGTDSRRKLDLWTHGAFATCLTGFFIIQGFGLIRLWESILSAGHQSRVFFLLMLSMIASIVSWWLFIRKVRRVSH